MIEKSFYLVWRSGGLSPTHRHENVDLARAEAKRLAQVEPGIEYFVLRAVEGHFYSEYPWRTRSFCKS